MSNAAHLAALYPFLAGKAQDAERLDAALLRSIADKAEDGRAVSARFFAEAGLTLLAAARTLAKVYENGGRLFALGNGGSSCDAAHIAVEFLHPVTAGRPALAAQSLTADTAMLSAIGNDLGFEHVFVRQLVAQGRAGDAVIGVSTSGNATNILAGFAKAKEMGMATIALTGGDGGQMRGSAGGRSLPGRAVELDPPRPGVPRRGLHHRHPVGPGAQPLGGPARSAAVI